MVRSSVVSAVSSACEIRLVLDRRCFWSTNSKRSSRRKAPGSLATPCVDQLVLSTQKAEPQRLPSLRWQIYSSLFSPPQIFSRAPVQRQSARNYSTATAVPLEQQKSGGEGRGARRRGGVERGVKLR